MDVYQTTRVNVEFSIKFVSFQARSQGTVGIGTASLVMCVRPSVGLNDIDSMPNGFSWEVMGAIFSTKMCRHTSDLDKNNRYSTGRRSRYCDGHRPFCAMDEQAVD